MSTWILGWSEPVSTNLIHTRNRVLIWNCLKKLWGEKLSTYIEEVEELRLDSNHSSTDDSHTTFTTVHWMFRSSFFRYVENEPSDLVSATLEPGGTFLKTVDSGSRTLLRVSSHVPLWDVSRLLGTLESPFSPRIGRGSRKSSISEGRGRKLMSIHRLRLGLDGPTYEEFRNWGSLSFFFFFF